MAGRIIGGGGEVRIRKWQQSFVYQVPGDVHSFGADLRCELRKLFVVGQQVSPFLHVCAAAG